jgi:hypothetical protein
LSRCDAETIVFAVTSLKVLASASNTTSCSTTTILTNTRLANIATSTTVLWVGDGIGTAWADRRRGRGSSPCIIEGDGCICDDCQGGGLYGSAIFKPRLDTYSSCGSIGQNPKARTSACVTTRLGADSGVEWNTRSRNLSLCLNGCSGSSHEIGGIGCDDWSYSFLEEVAAIN